MGFNYGYEKKKFDSRWKRLEVEYEPIFITLFYFYPAKRRKVTRRN